MSLTQLKKELKKVSSKKKAEGLQRFFKTGPGQYGEGDKFLGVMVPEQRKVAKKFKDLPLDQAIELLHSSIHEHRLTALFILIDQYKRGDDVLKTKIIKLYLKNTKYINNWDLIDLSAPKIMGDYLLDKPRDILYELVKSNNLWKRRIAILATAAFISKNDFKDTLKISKLLLNDSHDLIHKAVGWMLREVGKRDQPTEEQFLTKHYKTMPRTMLRYAIERFSDSKRAYYMRKN